MKIKFDSKVSAVAGQALAPLAGSLYASLGAHRMAVVELRSVERNDLAESEDREPWVKIRIAHLETANEEQEELLRQALRALRLHRTATGTLDEDHQVELAASTLEATAGRLHAVEAARLRVGAQAWLDYARRVLALKEPALSELRHELDVVAGGLETLLHGPHGQLSLEEASE